MVVELLGRMVRGPGLKAGCELTRYHPSRGQFKPEQVSSTSPVRELGLFKLYPALYVDQLQSNEQPHKLSSKQKDATVAQGTATHDFSKAKRCNCS